MPLVEHLYELRSRLAKSMLAVTVGIVLAFVFRDQVFDFLKQPYCDADIQNLVQDTDGRKSCGLVSLNPLEQFSLTLRISMIAGIVGSAPVWLYQIGAFITPALHKKEKRYAGGFLLASLVMFIAGVAFAYVTLERALTFLLNFGDGVVAVTSISSYFGFVTLSLLAFGIAFEFPVIIMFLNVVGVLSSQRMRKWRRGMIVGIAVAAAVLTPSTDPYTFAAMGVPLVVLYELCIVLARVRERSRRKAIEGDPVHALDDDEASPSPLAATPVEAPSSVD